MPTSPDQRLNPLPPIRVVSPLLPMLLRHEAPASSILERLLQHAIAANLQMHSCVPDSSMMTCHASGLGEGAGEHVT